jgi:hypothetical protein
MSSLASVVGRNVFKYKLNQIVWYVKSGKNHSARILSRKYVDNAHDNWGSTQAQRDAFKTFGRASIVYATIHGKFEEPELFPSEKDLFHFKLRTGL